MLGSPHASHLCFTDVHELTEPMQYVGCGIEFVHGKRSEQRVPGTRPPRRPRTAGAGVRRRAAAPRAPQYPEPPRLIETQEAIDEGQSEGRPRRARGRDTKIDKDSQGK
ncbi:hypothetical protein EVAR_35192_1 [Eumeta japonica]|uniref:Uncharacterized protein n=1 Tax=Eumeta variegata TaxID=151549 RepID=A0A4C1VDC6_EUMVA|nr:hypothetical protein EVAR_35192_1 [Eumeta japonica]